MLLEKPRQLTSEELYSGERFQSGWWVAKAQFYKLVQESERGYQLAREFLLNLNCMVRVPAPKSEGGADWISRTGLRASWAKESMLGLLSHSRNLELT